MLNAPAKTAIEALFIETGKIPIRFIVSMRRLAYWWHLLQQDNDSMLYKAYLAQKMNSVKGVWVKLLEKDKKDFDLDIEDEEL